jgi:hypothetical protein
LYAYVQAQPQRELQPVGSRGRSSAAAGAAVAPVLEPQQSVGDRLVDSFTAQSLDLPPQAAKVCVCARERETQREREREREMEREKEITISY